ncbi:hypothetical protein HJA82_28920 [Rhizobium bangladeshense]|uniref:hypothetical protein n=1 Tax=Rhizobium TaxID=379 RepID=UPI001C8324BC|nr:MULTISPECIES: hypothetical protein [Rhizobium]MBX4911336.1 hypothetical protein [Rhizobium bangladeshense]MBX5130796.1 hypothetical protein [Rhizobium lentis]
MKRPAAQTKPATATKANIQPKPQSASSMKFLGSLAAEPVEASDNMKDKAAILRDLNFKVDPEFHTKFKMTAAAAGKSMKELLEECFDAWVQIRKG